ncbi:MAG: hypothetical protein GY858_00535 [Candidatus Omnitrophica bacterium]|nr:hypothetical protein [Candidatus Omnitrophota bacterium]
MKKKVVYIMLLVLILPLVCFAQSDYGTLSSDKKMQHLKRFLTGYQEDLKEIEEREEKIFAIKDMSQIISYFLEEPDMPAMLQALNFLLLSISPEFWEFWGNEDTKIADDIAQVYLKVIKHKNPIIHLYGIVSLEEIKDDIQRSEGWQYDNDIPFLKKIVEAIQEKHVLSVQDKEFIKQYKECYAYFLPIFQEKKGEVIDAAGLTAVFEKADPSVQFFLVFRIATTIGWLPNEKLRKEAIKAVTQLEDKGDVYVKGYILVHITGNEERVNAFLRNSIDPDIFITVAEFLNSRNMFLTLESWPDGNNLDTFFSKASSIQRGLLLKFIQDTMNDN